MAAAQAGWRDTLSRFADRSRAAGERAVAGAEEDTAQPGPPVATNRGPSATDWTPRSLQARYASVLRDIGSLQAQAEQYQTHPPPSRNLVRGMGGLASQQHCGKKPSEQHARQDQQQQQSGQRNLDHTRHKVHRSAASDPQRRKANTRQGLWRAFEDAAVVQREHGQQQQQQQCRQQISAQKQRQHTGLAGHDVIYDPDKIMREFAGSRSMGRQEEPPQQQQQQQQQFYGTRDQRQVRVQEHHRQPQLKQRQEPRQQQHRRRAQSQHRCKCRSNGAHCLCRHQRHSEPESGRNPETSTQCNHSNNPHCNDNRNHHDHRPANEDKPGHEARAHHDFELEAGLHSSETFSAATAGATNARDSTSLRLLVPASTRGSPDAAKPQPIGPSQARGKIDMGTQVFANERVHCINIGTQATSDTPAKPQPRQMRRAQRRVARQRIVVPPLKLPTPPKASTPSPTASATVTASIHAAALEDERLRKLEQAQVRIADRLREQGLKRHCLRIWRRRTFAQLMERAGTSEALEGKLRDVERRLSTQAHQDEETAHMERAYQRALAATATSAQSPVLSAQVEPDSLASRMSRAATAAAAAGAWRSQRLPSLPEQDSEDEPTAPKRRLSDVSAAAAAAAGFRTRSMQRERERARGHERAWVEQAEAKAGRRQGLQSAIAAAAAAGWRIRRMSSASKHSENERSRALQVAIAAASAAEWRDSHARAGSPTREEREVAAAKERATRLAIAAAAVAGWRIQHISAVNDEEGERDSPELALQRRCFDKWRRRAYEQLSARDRSSSKAHEQLERRQERSRTLHLASEAAAAASWRSRRLSLADVSELKERHDRERRERKWSDAQRKEEHAAQARERVRDARDREREEAETALLSQQEAAAAAAAAVRVRHAQLLEQQERVEAEEEELIMRAHQLTLTFNSTTSKAVAAAEAVQVAVPAPAPVQTKRKSAPPCCPLVQEAQAEEPDDENDVYAAQHALRAWRKRALGRAVGVWRERSNSAQLLIDLTVRVWSAHKLNVLRAAWQRWASQRKLQQRLRGATAYWAMGALRNHALAWRNYACRAASERAQRREQAAGTHHAVVLASRHLFMWRRAREVRATGRQVAEQATQNQLRVAFQCWLSQGLARQDARRQAAERALAMGERARKRQAWRAWRLVAAGRTAMALHRASSARACLRAWSGLALAAQSRRDELLQCYRECVGARQRRMLSSTFARWSSKASKAESLRQRGAACWNSRIHRNLGNAMLQWRDLAVGRQQSRGSAESRARFTRLRSSLLAWRTAARYKQLARFASRFAARQALRVWKTDTRELKSARLLNGRAERHWKTARKRRAIAHWRGLPEERMLATVRAAHVLGVVARYRRDNLLKSALQSWVGQLYVVQRQRTMEEAARCCNRRRLLRGALRAWHAAQQAQQQQHADHEQQCMVAARASFLLSLDQSFDIPHAIRVLPAVFSGWTAPPVGLLFRTWRQVVTDNNAATAADRYRDTELRRRAFCAWLTYSRRQHNKAVNRANLLMAVAGSEELAVQYMVHAGGALGRRFERTQAAQTLARTHGRRRLLRRSFTRWLADSRTLTKAALLQSMGELHARRLVLARAMRLWIRASLASRLQHDREQVADQARSCVLRRRAFYRWVGAVLRVSQRYRSGNSQGSGDDEQNKSSRDGSAALRTRLGELDVNTTANTRQQPHVAPQSLERARRLAKLRRARDLDVRCSTCVQAARVGGLGHVENKQVRGVQAGGAVLGGAAGGRWDLDVMAGNLPAVCTCPTY